MKKFTITNGETKFTFEAKEGSDASCSDGYHTFEELYSHRCLLFINLCLVYPHLAFWRRHYPGWPLLGLELPSGQISYHVPEKYLPLFKGVVKEGGPEFDGHTSDDVLERLEVWARGICE